MMTAKEYIDSLRKLNTRVYMFGEKVDNWVDHPIIRPSINCVAMTYALAQDPQYEDLMTATSNLTGRKVNRFTHLHQSADDLVKKVKMQRLLGQKTASCFQRCVGMDAFNAVYSTTYEVDEKYGTHYHENFKKFLIMVQYEDLTVDGAMTDPKGDRSKAPHDQKAPDLFLHVVAQKQRQQELHEEILSMHTAYETDAKVVERCREYFAAHERLDAENQVLKRLYCTADGRLAGSAKIDFETYVQRRYFRQVIYEANRRLLTMSGHQFMLKLKETENSGRKSNEGLDLSVYSLVTDSERDIRTLSGGESFLAALAMALGLSDIAIRKAGAVHLDMMFIDEGFGTLDAQSRKQAIEVLSQLAGSERLVGIISHVTELKEQIEHRLYVTRTENGSEAVWEE